MSLGEFIAFLAAASLVIATLAVVLVAAVQTLGGAAGRTAGWVFGFLLLAAAAGAGWLTFGYEYYSDADTRVVGWPLPSVIFHRREPDGPWLDYVGWTTLFGWPLHFLAVMFVPSLAVLAMIRRRQ